MTKIYSNLSYKKVFLYRYLLIIVLVNIGLFSFFFFKTSSFKSTLNILGIILLFETIFYLIPLLILYFNYWNINKGVTLEVSNNSFVYDDGKLKSSFTVDKIAEVELNLSGNLYDKFVRLFFWDEYYYADINLVNGENFYITCLLCNEIEELVPLDLIKRRRRILPLIRPSEKMELKNKNIRNKTQSEKKVQQFLLKFKDKSKGELENIIENSNQYQKEAIQAAIKLRKTKH